MPNRRAVVGVSEKTRLLNYMLDNFEEIKERKYSGLNLSAIFDQVEAETSFNGVRNAIYNMSEGYKKANRMGITVLK